MISNTLTLYLNDVEKEQINPKDSIKMEIIEIIADIHEIETRKTNIKETKSFILKDKQIWTVSKLRKKRWIK